MLHTGKKFKDERGVITYNNDFDASGIKRIYTIENYSVHFIRGWQGHKVEQRWFACMQGSFEIAVIKIDDFENPDNGLIPQYYKVNSDNLDFLHVASGHITAIKAIEENSKLLVLADYFTGEIQDEYRFGLDYFKNEIFSNWILTNL